MMSKPFLEGKPWAIQKLTQMMERTMIRNQRQDMDKEVTLPPLYQNIIYLDFDYYQWIVSKVYHSIYIYFSKIQSISYLGT
jgi:hypothetical protein